MDAGGDNDAHLAAGVDDVDSAVIKVVEEDGVPARRFSQPIDFFLQGHDLVAGLAQGRYQSLVLGGRGGEVGFEPDNA